MIKTMLGNVNIMRLSLAILAVTVFIFASNFVIHELMLKGAYEQTANLWRTKPEMESLLIWMLIGQLLMAKYATILFVKGYENKGLMEGVRFGLYLGLFTTGMYLIQFVTTPLPTSLVWSWIWTGLFQWIGVGVVAAAVYRK